MTNNFLAGFHRPVGVSSSAAEVNEGALSLGDSAMLVIPGRPGKDTCDGITRRELLRIGGSAVIGITLGDILGLQKAQAQDSAAGGPGFGKAKSVILLYLQG